ncbi:hypothetical protein ABZ372_50800, partial [Streptomyces sp. NPDC005921]
WPPTSTPPDRTRCRCRRCRRPKPIAHALADTVAELREKRAVTARRTALVLDCTPATRSVSGPGGAFFEAWMRVRAEGVRPAVVLAERAADGHHLAARGIRELIRPTPPPAHGG